MFRHLAALALLVPCGGDAVAGAQVDFLSPDAKRGELLYSVHCVACHTAQKHWRQNKIALDWPGLVKQVSHWQAFAKVGWGEQEIVDVASYLNGAFYHYPVEK
jgi:mono/diheme cytochrome c family protein